MHPLPLITSLSNPTIKHTRALRQRKARAETGLFAVEGLHHIGEAIEAGWDVETLLYAPDLLISGFGAELLERARALPTRLQPVSVQAMESIAEKENPQGMLAIVRQRDWDIVSLEAATSLVALISPQDPGNVGAILRAIDAVGAEGLFLLDASVDLYHPTVVRASMGTLFWEPVIHATFQEFTTWAKAHGKQVIGTSAHAETDYHDLVPHKPWVLVMGSEQKGLSSEQRAACDVTVSLPMRGRVSSLNLAVATGILLYAFMS